MPVLEPPASSNAEVSAVDRAHVFHSWSAQHLINPMPLAGGEGCEFWDHDGNRWLDFSSQLVNLNLGHQHPKVIAAIVEQAERLCTVAPSFANQTRNQAAALIASHAPDGLDRVFFTNAGAEANENAIRMARHHTGRDKVLATYRSYHGGHRCHHGPHRRAPALGLRAGHPRRRPLHGPLPLSLVVRIHLRGRGSRAGAGAPGRGHPVRGGPHDRRDHPRDGGGHQRRAGPPAGLPPWRAGAVRRARHPAHPRRGDGGLRPHRSLVRRWSTSTWCPTCSPSPRA